MSLYTFFFFTTAWQMPGPGEPARNQLRIARDAKPTGNDKHPFSARAMMLLRLRSVKLDYALPSAHIRREWQADSSLPRNLSFLRCLETLFL